jgi:hypothetical protein
MNYRSRHRTEVQSLVWLRQNTVDLKAKPLRMNIVVNSEMII